MLVNGSSARWATSWRTRERESEEVGGRIASSRSDGKPLSLGFEEEQEEEEEHDFERVLTA